MGRKSRLKWERRKRDGWPFRGGAADVWRLMSESAREGALREAAGVCGKRAAEFYRLNVEGGMGKAKSYQHGREADACGDAILALLHTPPRGGA